MKKQILGIIMVLLLASPVIAQEIEVTPGITPDQEFLWKLDMIMEQVQVMLTFNQRDKVMLKIKIAEERLSEMKQMVNENKVQYMKKAENKRNEIINEVEVDTAKLTTAGDKNMVMDKLQKHIQTLEQVQSRINNRVQVGIDKGQFQEGIDNAVDKSNQVIERMRSKY